MFGLFAFLPYYALLALNTPTPSTIFANLYHLGNVLSKFLWLLLLDVFLREQSSQAILKALRDENLNDPRERIEIAQSHVFYKPSLLGQS